MRTHLKYGILAAVVTVPVIAAAALVPAAASSGTVSSAFGIAATGLVNIPQTPAVTSDAGPHYRSVVSVPGNPLVRLSVLRARAVPGHADAGVVDLRIAQPTTALHRIGPPAILTAKLITATCDEGTGTSHLVDVRLAGHGLAATAAPNSRLTAPIRGVGAVQVTMNKQAHNPDGTLTITALEVAVHALHGRTQTIAISSATCATEATGGGGEAPRPTPIPSNLPVTG